MRTLVKLLLALGLTALLGGCVCVPVGPPRGYVGVGVVAPAPGYYHRW